MRLPLILAAAVLATPALAQEADAPPVVFRDGDAAMSCPQIADEAAALSETMGGRGGPGVIGAVTGAARAGASMLIPGAGLAIAGVDALTREQRERKEAEEAAVEHRWYYLNGLYAGRCNTPPPAPPPTVPAQPQN
jgi:hypothetical protein